VNCISFSISNFPAVRAAKIAAVIGSCFYLSACASIGFGGPETEIDTASTSSVGTNPAILAGIDPSDWQILMQTVGAVEQQELKEERSVIAWINPKTGSKGEITDISAHQSIMDQECRSFKSSMHRITGVENVAGEICRSRKGNWEMTGFSSGTAA
jgi:surface antigen